MPTTRQYRKAALRREPSIGRIYAVTSLTATTIVVDSLTGREPDDWFIDWWAVRGDTATAADRVRRVTDYDRGNRSFTIVGGYGDTTATSEEVELYNPEFLPEYFDEALDQVLHRLRFTDEEIIPCAGPGWYNLNQLALGSEQPWITSPRYISGVYHVNSPVLSRNRIVSKWNSIDASGVLVPDFWTLAGSGGVFTRSTTSERGPYSLSAQRVGTDITISQTVWPWNGVSGDSLRGRPITVVGVVRSGQANSVRLRIVETLTDGTTVTTNSSYASATSQFGELSASATVNANTRSILFGAEVKVNETALIDELYLIDGTLADTVRRNDYEAWQHEIYPSYRQSGSVVEMLAPAGLNGIGSHYLIQSYHPYFSPTVRLGVNDGWNCDAPLEVVAEWVLYEVLKRVAAAASGDTRSQYLQLAEDHRSTAKTMALGNVYEDDLPHFGVAPKKFMRRLGPAARRVV